MPLIENKAKLNSKQNRKTNNRSASKINNSKTKQRRKIYGSK
jgi:hypothetical protein